MTFLPYRFLGRLAAAELAVLLAHAADPVVFFQHTVIDGAGPQSLWGKCAADLNGDGRPDLIAGGWRSGGLVWYENPNWAKHRIDPTAQISTDIEVADIDRDGKPDVVAVTRNGIVWYRNPDWRPHLVAKDTVHDLEVADFDGDGYVDIVARNQNLSRNASGATMFVYRQESPGNWTRQTWPIPDGEGLAAADLDGDGDLDLVVNGTWYENRRDLSAPWPAHVFGPAWKHDKTFIAVGDLDRDGRPDIVLAPSEPKGQRYRISWFESPRNPKADPWVEHVIDPDVETVHHFVGIADFDGDGQPDVASAAMLQGTPPQEVKIYLNGGNGKAWTKRVLGITGSHSMRIVDLEGNGTPSLFGGNHQESKVELWRNTTRRGRLALNRWQRHVVDAEKPWKSVFIDAQDLDGDGLKDIVTGGWWYRNPGAPGERWKRATIGEPLHNMAAVYDFDGDGFFDVLGTQGKGPAASPELVWAKGDGHGAFVVYNNIPTTLGDFLQGVAVARFAPNGPLEVALSWHNGTGKGVQMLTVPPDPVGKPWGWRHLSIFDQQEALSVADIDGDGLSDLVLGTRWLRNEKTSWRVLTIGATDDPPDRNRLADMNGDGRLDVVIGFLGISKPGKISWFEAPSDPKSGPWVEHVVASDVIGPMSLDVADLDGDGDADLVVGEHNLKKPAAARLFVFENVDGRGTQWRRHTIFQGDEHHDGARLVDIDGDGDLDVISIGWGHARVLLYENRAVDRQAGTRRR